MEVVLHRTLPSDDGLGMQQALRDKVPTRALLALEVEALTPQVQSTASNSLDNKQALDFDMC